MQQIGNYRGDSRVQGEESGSPRNPAFPFTSEKTGLGSTYPGWEEMPLEGDAWVFTAKNPWAQAVERDRLGKAAAFQQGFSSDVGESTGSISASSIRGKVKTWLDVLSHC